MTEILTKVSLLKLTWPIWKAVQHMIETRNLQGYARNDVDPFGVHVVLVPPHRQAEFVALVNAFHEGSR